MNIWVDAKNPALYSSGISTWLETMLNDVDAGIKKQITLVYPRISDRAIYPEMDIARISLPWFSFLPKRVSQIIYDNFTFRIFARIKRPSVIFSPYFDVIMPRNIPSVISIHDICYLEAAQYYSRAQRAYFNSAMFRNMRRAKQFVTVSQTSRDELVKTLGLSSSAIHLVTNQPNQVFSDYAPSASEITQFRNRFEIGSKLVLYSSGYENRKNIPNLLKAFKLLSNLHPEIHLLVTGKQQSKWASIIAEDVDLKRNISFLGFLSETEMKIAYSAVNAVVFPSMSEGLGMASLEAMETGTALACSDLPIFRELAANYAIFFDPTDPAAIAAGIKEATAMGPQPPRKFDPTVRLHALSTLWKSISSLGSES